MTDFIACNKTNDTINIAEAYFMEARRLHGIPRTIISDRDTKFLSNFWVTLWKMIGIKLCCSITYQPQTNSQTKVTNRTRSTLLRRLIEPQLRACDLLFPHVEFAYNQDNRNITLQGGIWY